MNNNVNVVDFANLSWIVYLYKADSDGNAA